MPMPEKLKELYDRLNKMKHKTPAQNAFLQAIKAVNTASDKLRKPDRYKRIPHLLAQDRDKLMDLHKAVGKAAEAIMKDENESPAVREIVEKFSTLASANYSRLGAYEPDKQPKTLDAIEEETRTMYLDHSGEDFANKKGNALSSRIPVSFRNNKGQRVNGLFTPKNQVNLYDSLNKKFNELAEQQSEDGLPNGFGKLFLKQLMTRIAEKLPEKIQKKEFNPAHYADDRSRVLGYLFEATLDEKDNDKIDAAMFTAVIKEFFPEAAKMSLVDISNALGAEAMVAMGEAMEPYVNHVTINMRDAGIPDGGRVDSRNSAMSAVADLLHMPNVIGRSRPMVLRDKDGNEIEGTFTAEVLGEDPMNLSHEARDVDEKAFEGTNGKALKDLADLQVLDFICGNVDRTFANMFYKLDKNHKLAGSTGIDNDCSLGTYIPKAGESFKRLAGLDYMLAVSESTYQRVMALDGDALKYALRGFGLSEKELNAAAKRLELLQDALTKGVEHYQQEDADDFSFSEDGEDNELQQAPEKNQAQNPEQARPLDKNGNPLPEIQLPNDGTPVKVEDGFIRVVPDKEFKRLKIDDLLVNQDARTGQRATNQTPKNRREEGNTFRAAYGGVACMSDDYRIQNRPKKIFTAPIMEHKNRSKWDELPRYLDQAEEFSASLGQNTRTFHSNGKYRDMESAAKDYIKVMRRIRERTRIANGDHLRESPDYKMDLQAVVTPKDLKDMQKAAEKLNKAAERYLKYKLGPNMDRSTDGLTEYSKGRVNCAKELLIATAKLKVLRGEELNEAQTNEREAKEALGRRFGDRQEEREYRNKQKPAPQPILR